MPTIPSPCSVTTWPRITATRLLQIIDISRFTETGSFRRPINPRNADLKRNILTIYIYLQSECNFDRCAHYSKAICSILQREISNLDSNLYWNIHIIKTKCCRESYYKIFTDIINL